MWCVCAKAKGLEVGGGWGSVEAKSGSLGNYWGIPLTSHLPPPPPCHDQCMKLVSDKCMSTVYF